MGASRFFHQTFFENSCFYFHLNKQEFSGKSRSCNSFSVILCVCVHREAEAGQGNSVPAFYQKEGNACEKKTKEL